MGGGGNLNIVKFCGFNLANYCHTQFNYMYSLLLETEWNELGDELCLN